MVEYRYHATVVRVIDGDTIVLRVDLGFRLWREDAFRLNGIDTPELRSPTYDEGAAARDRLAELCPVGSTLEVRTYKGPDKYGRYLADLHLADGTANDVLVAEGHAVTYTGGTR